MSITIIVLSGPICSGKSTLATMLQDKAGAKIVKTRELIVELVPDIEKTRKDLQKVGEKLDRETDGEWVRNGLVKLLLRNPPEKFVVIDSIRIEKQISALRKIAGYSIIHVHLDAEDSSLSDRFKKRKTSFKESKSYIEAQKNPTEKRVRLLSNIADISISTDRNTPDDVWTRVAARIGLRTPTSSQLVDVLVGGQYGSEGKGNIVHHIAPEYDVLVRVGGPNAGHKVYIPDADPFTFHQLPSGAISNSNALLVLGAGTVISLDRLRIEMKALSIPIDRLAIDPQAMIIDKRDIAYEVKKLKDTIASTAQGVGHATARKILNRFPDSNVKLARDIPEIKHFVRDTIEEISKALCQGKRILLEGTQGTSLSIHHGHYPHVTSRVTTATGCLAEAGIASQHVRKVILVCRTYPIRVGDTDTKMTSGYMSQKIDLETIASRSGLDIAELRGTETTSTTKRPRKIAEFDWAQLRRSTLLNGPTDIALTFVDYISKRNRDAYRYEQLSHETIRFIEEVEMVTGSPVSLISTQFALRNIIDRRAW